jgi:hypothetical protein
MIGTIRLETDDHGTATFSAICDDSLSGRVRCTVKGGGARSFDTQLHLTQEGRSVPFLLVPDRSVYEVGDTARFVVLSGLKTPETLFLDAVRNGQTVLTRMVGVDGGRGEVDLDLDAELAGILRLNLYRIDEEGQVHRDTRFLYVKPKGGVDVRIRLDREAYRPGDEAKAMIEVRGPDGEPRPGAVSLCAVDEAVFALQEIRPGFLETLLQIEEDLLDPKGQIKGIAALPVGEMIAGGDTRTPAAVSALGPTPHESSWMPNSFEEKSRELRRRKRRGRRFIGQAVAVSILCTILLLFLGLPATAVVLGLNRSRWAILPAGAWGLLSLLLCLVIATPLAMVGGKSAPMSDMAVGSGADEEEGDDEGSLLDSLVMTWETAEAKRVERSAKGERDAPPPRIRRYFPETLLWLPELVTDENGRAEWTFPLADSITTWRLTAQAVAGAGGVGSIAEPVRVFQDFFVDLDLPVELTRNDEIELPAVVYNYMKSEEDVRLRLETAEGIEVLGPSEVVLSIGPNAVRSATFRIRATRVGTWRVSLEGRGSASGDSLEKELRVVPDGRAVVETASDLLGDGTVSHDFVIPAETIPDSQTAVLKLYPGPVASVLEGLEKLVRMPHG